MDKATFLNAYKISEESGKLFTFNEFFKTEGDHPGTVYETEIGNLKTAAINATKQYALKEQLTKSGVLDPDYLIYKAGGIDKFTFDKDNNPIDVDESIKTYREDKTMAHLFKQKAGYEPSKGGSPTKNPFAKETFNLTEQGKLLKENPAQAKEMAAAAGITI